MYIYFCSLYSISMYLMLLCEWEMFMFVDVSVYHQFDVYTV